MKAAHELPCDPVSMLVYTEEVLIGAMLIAPAVVSPFVTDVLAPADFGLPSCGLTYEAILSLQAEAGPVDVLSVADRLERMGKLDEVGGILYLAGLGDRVVTVHAIHLEAWVARIKEGSLLRQLKSIAEETATSKLENKGFEQAREEIVTKLVGLRSNSRVEAKTLASGVKRSISAMQAIFDGKESPALRTGYAELDDAMAGGFWPSEMILLAGRPSMGKSALALNLALRVARTGRGVLFFSLEMPEAMLIPRILSIESRVSSTTLRRAKGFQNDEIPRIFKASGSLYSLPFAYVDSPGLTVSEIRRQTAVCIQQWKEKGIEPGMVVVDYLGLIASGSVESEEQRAQEVAKISAGLQRLARETRVPVMALSQLNRALERRPDKRPMMSDLRDSGSLEQDADTILFVYRDEVYNADTTDRGIAEVIIGKQRNGPLSTIKLRWEGEFQTFGGLDE